MTRNPVTFEAEARLSDAVALMNERHIRHMPVLHEGKLVGVLSDRDVHDALPSVLTLKDPEARKRALFITRVSQVCSKQPTVLDPSTTVLDAIATMRRARFGCCPVVEGDKLVGILTSGDLINLLERLLAHRP
jgi:acetoin utilization protein AcuB